MASGRKGQAMIDSNALLWFWSVLLAITTLASIFVLNPRLDPHGRVLSWPQLQLQLAFTPKNGVAVLESWGPDAVERYSRVIWIDLLFALSYGPALSLYAWRMGRSSIWAVVPLVAMAANLLETSAEMYWVAHHSVTHPLFALFFSHSLLATVEWLFAPIYMIQLAMLFLYWLRSQAMEVAFRRPVESRKNRLGP
jgi:hypothetical protein